MPRFWWHHPNFFPLILSQLTEWLNKVKGHEKQLFVGFHYTRLRLEVWDDFLGSHVSEGSWQTRYLNSMGRKSFKNI